MVSGTGRLGGRAHRYLIRLGSRELGSRSTPWAFCQFAGIGNLHVKDKKISFLIYTTMIVNGV